jgi:succinate dehydrogenase/fumarate reductase cytochrome b subunit
MSHLVSVSGILILLFVFFHFNLADYLSAKEELFPACRKPGQQREGS